MGKSVQNQHGSTSPLSQAEAVPQSARTAAANTTDWGLGQQTFVSCHTSCSGERSLPACRRPMVICNHMAFPPCASGESQRVRAS